MVKKIKKETTTYQCERCGLEYEKEELAKKCEEWCEKNPGSCNAEISKESINNKTINIR